MKSTLLCTLLLLALPGAQAAENPDASSASLQPLTPLESESARRELNELRGQIGDLSRRMGELSTRLGDVGPRAYAFRFLNETDRAMVGVVLSRQARGPRIDAVTPDGPAQRAGLRNGDILTSINGKPIDTRKAEAALEQARAALGELKEGQEVRIRYLRDNKEMPELTLKAERREALSWPRLFAGEDNAAVDIDRDRLRREKRVVMEHAPRAASAHATRVIELRESARSHSRLMPWWGVNLAALNSDLGRYFGADSGVLVLSASDDALPGLKAGDVIRSIAGKPVQRPDDALRSLRDQRSGSQIEIAILRERKTQTLKLTVPDYKSIFSMDALPTPPTPPLPPVAPAAPGPAPLPGAVPVPPAPPVAPKPAISPTT